MNVVKVNSIKTQTQTQTPVNTPNITKESLNIIQKKDIDFESKTIENDIIQLDPYEQACFTVQIDNKDKTIKSLFYSLICDDQLYSLNHYLYKIEKSSFKICIENKIENSRIISISYLAFF